MRFVFSNDIVVDFYVASCARFYCMISLSCSCSIAQYMYVTLHGEYSLNLDVFHAVERDQAGLSPV